MYAVHDRKGPSTIGRTCFSPSRAKPSSVTCASDVPVASTNLNRDLGNTKYSLCNRVQLSGVSFLLVPCGSRTAYLDSAIYICAVHGPLDQSAHPWGTFL